MLRRLVFVFLASLCFFGPRLVSLVHHGEMRARMGLGRALVRGVGFLLLFI